MNTFSMNIAITISHAYVPYAYTLCYLFRHMIPQSPRYMSFTEI